MVTFEFAGAEGIAQSAVSDTVSDAAVRLPRICSARVATTAAITANTSTIVNGVQGKCCVVISLRKFFDDCTGSGVFATSWPASRVTLSYTGLYVPAHPGLITNTVE